MKLQRFKKITMIAFSILSLSAQAQAACRGLPSDATNLRQPGNDRDYARIELERRGCIATLHFDARGDIPAQSHEYSVKTDEFSPNRNHGVDKFTLTSKDDSSEERKLVIDFSTVEMGYRCLILDGTSRSPDCHGIQR